MKKITIPADISLSGVPPHLTTYTFAMFVEHAINDTAFGKGLKTLESRVTIKRAFLDQSPGSVVELNSTDWETLSGVVREPTLPYVPAVAEQLLPFIYAIVHPTL